MLLSPWLASSARKAVQRHYPLSKYQLSKMSSIVNAHIQVLGTGANELAPSFYLFTDSKRYVFNCGENFQRFRSEFRLPLTKLSFFITHVSWRNLGGFAGAAMSSRDNGVPCLPLYGPEMIEDFVDLTRYFTGSKKIKLLTPWSAEGSKTLSPDVYEDENVNIRTIPLYSSDSQSDSNLPGSPATKRRKVSSNTAAFVCKLSDVRGKFDVAKAKALGVPPGPIYKKLTAGISVTATDGRVVQPHEVMGSSRIGPVMIVVECPNESYIPSVASNPSLSIEAFSASNQIVALIVHMSPAHILKDQQYRKWIESFGSTTKHLILNESMCPTELALRRYLKVQVPLHLMNPTVYHPPANTPSMATVLEYLPKDSIVYGQTLLKYHLKPATRIGEDASATLGPLSEEYGKHLQDIETDKQLLNAIESSQSNSGNKKSAASKKLVPSKPLVPKPTEADNPILTFLGTGSSAPTCYRNVTGILVQTASNGNVLFDCGEGSLSQIYRCYGMERGDEIVRNIDGIFISHIHGDHHLGLLSVLFKREQLQHSNRDPPLLIAPDLLLTWLKRYSHTIQKVSYRSVDCKALEKSSTTKPVFGVPTELDFETVPVLHCKSAYGVVMRQASDWSIVYSGDTRPCQALVEAGRGTNLLIHEATFEDNLVEDAKAKMHCTFGEALEVSSKMCSKFTVMTHFSSRYPRIPTVLMDARVGSKVGVAFDCMSIGLKDLESLCVDLPVMKKIFSHVTEEGEEEQSMSYQDWGHEDAAA